jgi:S-formylglutathione hydrolase FrmB
MKTIIRILLPIALVGLISSCGGNCPKVKQVYNPTPSIVGYTIESKAIAAGKLEKRPVTNVLVSLPASYASSPGRRYPVVYLLHGFGDDMLRMLTTFRGALSSAGDSMPEVIFATIDGSNSLGGSFYANSPATGNWQDLIAEELVSLIDTKYRTVASPAGRMLAGFSMGGAGTWNIALARPDVFSAAWACCPGAWDQDGLRDTLVSWEPIYRVAYGAAYAPDLSLPPPYGRVPAFDGTATDDAIIAAWERGFGEIDEKLADYSKKSEKLSAIAFAYGIQDSYRWIPRGTCYIADKMLKAGIPVTIQGFEAGHVIRPAMLRDSFIPFVSATFR